MTQLPTAHEIARKGHWETASDTVTLSYEDRFLRRKVLTAGSGAGFLVDLAHTESLDHGDAFRLTDGRLVEVVAASEPLLAVSGDDLPRIAWHIGNRHTPCQIEAVRLLIQRDPFEPLDITDLRIETDGCPAGYWKSELDNRCYKYADGY